MAANSCTRKTDAHSPYIAAPASVEPTTTTKSPPNAFRSKRDISSVITSHTAPPISPVPLRSPEGTRASHALDAQPASRPRSDPVPSRAGAGG